MDSYGLNERHRRLDNIADSESVTMFPHPLAIKQVYTKEIGWDFQRDVEALVIDEGIALGQAWHEETANAYMKYIMVGGDPSEWFSDEDSYIAIRHGNRWLCNYKLWDWPELEKELFRLIENRLMRETKKGLRKQAVSY